MPAKNQFSKNKELEPYEEVKFEQFLNIVKKGNVKNWSIVAEALGVHNNTITAWKRHPEARKAIAEGIIHSLDQMERVGKNDWRMWAEKAKMLGVNPPQKAEVKVQRNPIDEILRHYGLEIKEVIDVGQTETTESGSSQDTA